MIDHISVHVRDLDRALAFYKAALAPVGYTVIMQFPGVAGLGEGGKPDLWLGVSEQVTPTHIAISGHRAGVDAFHAAALAAGGQDNGAPGLRPQYHPNYYGAFVLDPDGNNLEVVCHETPGARSKAVAKKRTAKKAVAKKRAAKKTTAKRASAKRGAKKTKR